MALNWAGDEKRQPIAAPITLARIELPPDDDREIEREVKEAAQRVANQKIIRAGREAWATVAKADSFEGWKAIGAALSIGKTHALRASGAEQAWGRNYSLAFSEWIKQHGFEQMPKSTRSVSIELHENCAAIEQWRATQSEKERRRLIHPLSNVRRWRQATQSKAKPDALMKAEKAWQHFLTCMKALPPEQAVPLWQDVEARTAKLAPITV
jgi:hypothetical protein